MKTTTKHKIRAYVPGRNSAKRLPKTSQKYRGFVVQSWLHKLGREDFLLGRIPKLKTLNKNFKAIHNYADSGNSLELACHVPYYVYLHPV
jgi:hypothetical protein